MTGIFEVYINGKHIKDVEMPAMEIDRTTVLEPSIISKMLDDLQNWEITAKQDDEFKFELRVRCELPT